MVAKLNKMPDILSGVWANLNWLGDPAVSPAATVSTVLRLATSPVWFAKLYAPFSIWFLGLSTWIFLRALKLNIVACSLGTIAATLNVNFFSSACWGVCSHPITFGAAYLALAAVVRSPRGWGNIILAGLAVGVAIMEGYDIGAIFSLYVAAFILFYTINSDERPFLPKAASGTLRVAVVAIIAALASAHTLSSLIATQVKGVTDEKANMTPEQRWDWATQWSMPPSELPRIFISGLYGYRMDTPKDMAALSDWFQGGVYWGRVGEAPIIEKYIEDYHAKGNQGMPPGIPSSAWRFNGGGEYVGVLVLVLSIWAVVQSFRKRDSVFSLTERKLIWFWAGAALISLLLAIGRYGPFYRLFYMLPHAGNIRNASKFMHPFHWSLVVLFAYGVQGLSRRYLSQPVTGSEAVSRKAAVPQKTGWAALSVFDQRWVLFSVLAIGLGLISLLAYALNRDGLIKHLMEVGYGDPGLASQIASFSIKEFGIFIVFLILTVALLTAIFMRGFVGSKWGPILLGALLIVDLARSNLPWIIYQNYVQKYASNPVIDFLRDKPYEHRVTMFPLDRLAGGQQLPKELSQLQGQLSGFYGIEWMQHHFQYYDIQALDDVQRPREAPDFRAYERGVLATVPFRHWELTNTKYFLAPNALGPSLAQMGFVPVLGFSIQPKPDATEPLVSYEQMMAVPTTNNPQYAIFEFTKALPRAQLYSNWQINTNDDATLNLLASPGFNPHQTVIVSAPIPLMPSGVTNQNAGSVEITEYAPKKVVLHANVKTPSVLLLNDKYDPNWRVTVDGKPETVLRANFIMRGVALTPGDHRIVFKFEPSLTSLYISIAAILLGIVLVGILVVAKSRNTASPQPAPPSKPASPAKKEK
jgi:hypothetical protein